jgi:hypothetical protein
VIRDRRFVALLAGGLVSRPGSLVMFVHAAARLSEQVQVA